MTKGGTKNSLRSSSVMDWQPPIEPPALIRVAGITGNAFKKLEEGMGKEQVLKLLGRPDGMSRDQNAETLTYRNRLMSGWAWDRADYYVILVDGRVASYGTGDVRERQSPIIVAPTLASPMPVPPAPPTLRGQCFLQREWTSGFYKNCVFRCVAGEVVRTVTSTELCPLHTAQ